MSDLKSVMRSEDYPEGYFERGEHSNYHNYGHDPGWVPTLDVMSLYIPEGARIIEMACAKGYFVLDAIKRGYDAFGMDISEYAISRARPEVADHVVVHNVALPWPVEAGEADIVAGFEFMEHVPDHEIPYVLEQVWRALKPGGLMWLRIGFDVAKSHPDHPFIGKSHDHDDTHVANHDREWWERAFYRFGFTHVPEAERDMDEAFKDRDWIMRSFVWRKPDKEPIFGRGACDICEMQPHSPQCLRVDE